MKNMNETIAAIGSTIAARKEQIPIIVAERDRVVDQITSLDTLQDQRGVLFEMGADESALSEVVIAQDILKSLSSELRNYCAELEVEFTRDTLNIGVFGAARMGKFTTLQHITGLTDKQIPSGGLNPVTVVRSEICNLSRNEAIDTFKTKQAFLDCPRAFVRRLVTKANV